MILFQPFYTLALYSSVSDCTPGKKKSLYTLFSWLINMVLCSLPPERLLPYRAALTYMMLKDPCMRIAYGAYISKDSNSRIVHPPLNLERRTLRDRLGDS